MPRNFVSTHIDQEVDHTSGTDFQFITEESFHLSNVDPNDHRLSHSNELLEFNHLFGYEEPQDAIISLLGVYENDTSIVIVTEFCGQGDLLAFLQRQPHSRLDTEDAIYRFRQIAVAVAHMHGRGWAHRDLSLENIMVRDDKS